MKINAKKILSFVTLVAVLLMTFDGGIRGGRIRARRAGRQPDSSRAAAVCGL